MLKGISSISLATILACVADCVNRTETSKHTETSIRAAAPSFAALVPEEEKGRVLKTPEDVKALFFKPESWLEAEYGGRKFIFCAKSLLYVTVPRLVVHAWVFQSKFDRWERVMAVEIIGAPQLKLSVDVKTGIFSAKGSRYSKPEKELLTFDLNATE
jgi:hypothetical protein